MWQEECAERIAGELLLDPSHPRLAKASSLLHAFRGSGGHAEARDIKQALEAHGVVLRSPRPEISRRDVVELCSPNGAPAPAGPDLDAQGIRVTHWSAGSAGRDAAPLSSLDREQRRDDQILWFDVDAAPLGASVEAVHARVHDVTTALAPWCPRLDESMVADLLGRDVQPKIETYGDERAGVRSISMAAIVARETPDDDDDFDGVDEQLVIQIVEAVCGPGWIITCWHPCRLLVGQGEVHDGPPLLREPFLSHVAHRWLHDDRDHDGPGEKSAADLGIYLARSLVATYGASLRMLQRWVSTWEVAFYKTLGAEDGGKRLKDAAREISNFLSMVAEFSRCVTAFKLAGEEMPNKTWFPDRSPAIGSAGGHGTQAEILAAAVESAERKLERISEEIRADMDLLMIQSQAHQQEASERLQGYLGKVTGLVLVPTFVAGLFGANTALPGGGSWMGFEIMLLLMAISAAASYLVIRRLIR